MSLDTNALQTALSDPSLASMDDATVNALPGFGVPKLTPKSGKVTYATLAAVWGAQAAALFFAGIQQAKAQTANPQFAALAGYVDALLIGPGIDPGNADVPTEGAAFVAAGLATQEQFTAVFYDTSYIAGQATQVSDITTSRQAIAYRQFLLSLRQQLDAFYNRAVVQLGVVQQAETQPTLSDLIDSVKNG